MGDSNRIVIIGGGAAGMSAATAARKVDPHCGITVCERGSAVAYAHCGLPYFISGIVKDHRELFVYPFEHFRDDLDIDVLLHTEATALDHGRRTVTVRSVRDGAVHDLRYDSLVIATGACPVTPSYAEFGFANLFTFRTMDDALRLSDYLSRRSPGKALVIGGGLVGVLMAEAFALRGMDTVIIEMRDALLPEFEEEIAGKAEEVLRTKGISVFTGLSASGFDCENGIIRGVRAGRYLFEADLVLCASGIRPETLLLGEYAGKSGALETDDRMATPVRGVYACGDCTTAYHTTAGRRLYRPLGTTANRQGRVAGENAAGRYSIFSGIAGTQALKLFELEMARTGLSGEEAKQAGIRTVDATAVSPSVATYIPGSHPITTKVTVEAGSGRVVGAQMAGCGEVAKRIDVFVSIIQNGMRVGDALNLDLSYTPRCSPIWDPVLYCLKEVHKKLNR